MEQWKDIPGFEGCYKASTAGHVRSLDRIITDVLGRKRKYKGQLLHPTPAPSGHMKIILGCKVGTKNVHQLVMLAFVGPAPSGHEVMHKNHNPSDNRLSNLKYGTRSENVKMDYQEGGSRLRPIIGTPLGSGCEVHFLTQTAATRKLSKNNCPHSNSISANLNGRTRHAYGYTWRYV